MPEQGFILEHTVAYWEERSDKQIEDEGYNVEYIRQKQAFMRGDSKDDPDNPITDEVLTQLDEPSPLFPDPQLEPAPTPPIPPNTSFSDTSAEPE